MVYIPNIYLFLSVRKYVQFDIAGNTKESSLNKLLGIWLWSKAAMQKSSLKAFMNDDSGNPNTKYIFSFPALRTVVSTKSIFFIS